jgi:hypothetical protein
MIVRSVVILPALVGCVAAGALGTQPAEEAPVGVADQATWLVGGDGSRLVPDGPADRTSSRIPDVPDVVEEALDVASDPDGGGLPPRTASLAQDPTRRAPISGWYLERSGKLGTDVEAATWGRVKKLFSE